MILIRDIIATVADEFGVTPADILGKSHKPEFTRPRFAAIYLARHTGKRSLPEIGRAFGGRDHTTILNALRRFEALDDPETMHGLACAAVRLKAKHFTVTIHREAA
jgi:chromosomal replication initiator protein